MEQTKLSRRRKAAVAPRGDGLTRALHKAQQTPETKSYNYPVKLPDLLPAIVPKGRKAAIAMDSNFGHSFPSAYGFGDVAGFPGYPYLSMLATRAEYRLMSGALSKEMTREWITLNSTETDDDATKKKITELTKKMQDIGLQQVIARAVEHDAHFGRAQILIDIEGHDLDTPLILDKRTIKKDTFNKVTCVEAIWTTPASYNAADPLAPDFYKPSKWFMLGKQVHASRLLTIITRPLPDMLKPAFNFGGMSLSQLAEPYVDNWLRTRQSVSDLINNFSITALATSMDQVLDGNGEGPESDGTNLFKRAALFTAARSNKGLMLLDKDREEIVKADTSLAGLHELQAQSQEHMCSVSTTPSTILLGVAPSGFGNVSEGEIATWEKRVGSEQESNYRLPIYIILCILQLSMYGAIDENITFTFNPLSQMTPKEFSEIRLADAQVAQIYTGAGAIDGMEVREKLARDPDSGYQGLDLNVEITDPNLEDEDKDDEVDE